MSESSEKNLQISVPAAQVEQNNVVFRIQPKPAPKLPKVQKYRSFSIDSHRTSHTLCVGDRSIAKCELFALLQEQGKLNSTIPCDVRFGAKKAQVLGIDWSPLAYNGPIEWHFRWKDAVPCSITGNENKIVIRVHDMTPGVGEAVIDAISAALYERWTDPTPQRSLTIHTAQRTPNGTFQWEALCTRLQRPLDTIYIDQALKNRLVSELVQFYASRDWYDRCGVTWKRVHIFHGPSGCGKTSLILALASAFNQHIAKLTITRDLDSRAVENLIHRAPSNAFVLLEDADALFVGREATDVSSLDFSTLINCMDGVTTRPGLVLFLTTNYLQRLDAALCRPGRVDCCVEFAHASRAQLTQALEMLAAPYAHEHHEFLARNEGISIAALQKHAFDCKMQNRASLL